MTKIDIFSGFLGAGKTTLIKLILKFYSLQDGQMYINDINYQDVNPFSLRRNMAVVFQDYQIYAVSIAENIRFVYRGNAFGN